MTRNSKEWLWQWVLPTIIAGLTMVGGLITYFESHVYLKSDGQHLEQRIAGIEEKIDYIYHYLLEHKDGSNESGE